MGASRSACQSWSEIAGVVAFNVDDLETFIQAKSTSPLNPEDDKPKKTQASLSQLIFKQELELLARPKLEEEMTRADLVRPAMNGSRAKKWLTNTANDEYGQHIAHPHRELLLGHECVLARRLQQKKVDASGDLLLTCEKRVGPHKTPNLKHHNRFVSVMSLW